MMPLILTSDINMHPDPVKKLFQLAGTSTCTAEYVCMYVLVHCLQIKFSVVAQVVVVTEVRVRKLMDHIDGLREKAAS